MPLEEPSWWYGASPDDWRVRALRPVARLYAWAGERRFSRAEPLRSPLPVICVGNFTAGGTGKTPLTLHIARHLREAGETPALLTRGYGGRLKGPVLVDPDIHTAADVGDEPLLLARLAATVVARSRSQGAEAIAAGLVPGASVILMDDGLQNPSLAKDIVLAVVDGRRGVGNGEVIPAGPLRAQLSFQLERVDAVIVNCGLADDSLEDTRVTDGPLEPDILQQLRRDFRGPVIAVHIAPVVDAALLGGQPLLAYAGIANPQRFFDLLDRIGASVAGRVSFKDHHPFSDEDARRLMDHASAAGARLVTTEKDLARLSGARGRRGELARRTTPIPIRLVVGAGEEARLDGLVGVQKLKRLREQKTSGG